MSKKKNKLGKFLAFTTTAAAIGGTCYIFRDRIKESSIYKTISSKLSDHFNTFSDEFNDTDDEFFYDEDDDFANAFPENAEHSREYTSITINAREETPSENAEISEADNSSESENPKAIKKDNTFEDVKTDKEEPAFSNDDLIEIFPKNSISNLSSGKSSEHSDSDSKKSTDSTKTKDYENKGLSDVSEDPVTLEEQDKLDF